MKFDMGRAWNEAVAMLSANWKLVLVIAGVFFFLPLVAFALLIPGAGALSNPTAEPEEMLAALGAGVIVGYLVYTALTYIGTLALLNLLSDRTRPTVGQAIGAGARGFLTYFVAQLLMFLALALLAFVVVGGLTAISTALGVVGALIVLPLVVWIYVRLSLTAPVIAVEGVLNPIAALRRSWGLVKGNSLRLFAFYLVILVVMLVLFLVLSIVFGVFAALGGAGAALFVSAFVQGLITMAFAALFVAVVAAVHSQLAGPNAAQAREVFE